MGYQFCPEGQRRDFAIVARIPKDTRLKHLRERTCRKIKAKMLFELILCLVLLVCLSMSAGAETLHGDSDSRGVIGTLGGTSCAGTYAVGGCGADLGDGVVGRSQQGFAGRFEADQGIGVFGRSSSRAIVGTQGTTSCAGTYGVGGCAITGDGVVGRSQQGFAGRFEGKVLVRSLQITGGSDIAEPFEITGAESIKPGMVASIDPRHPGRLLISGKAYDRTVAGIVSGANGLNPGLTLKQKGITVDGTFPVALTGRVYCWADASNGPIQPGDLLTTSHTPGHAMKVTDYARAKGSIIGKAMTSLKTGRGLVLVLVTLQ
jgi:hypothetical protein